MELKNYQQQVIKDIDQFLTQLREQNDIDEAFKEHWKIKLGIENPFSIDGIERYKNNVPSVPNVCVKVPTAGGKTYIACNALRPIFKGLGIINKKSVVWLVPSTTILEQTIKNLSDSSHPYRQRINTHFGGKVEVFDKDSLLQGAGFNASTVQEQLNILVLSFDSFRSRKKDDRKIYQENGQLANFAYASTDKSYLLEEYDESALINVIRSLNPVVVVDESHNAESELSIEMLRNLNPCFILDLTATPRNNSNIISYVDALQLKKSNMVKLPLIVYNHKDKRGVIESAINLRNRLDAEARLEEKSGGKHIRPIVLFQAQPRTGEENTTFDKIKEILIKIGIPDEEIKIKTADRNEIKNIDLLSKDCKVKYIITVNALKEGWDCSFAYILASLADKSSKVDVEQIVGRILRQPYAYKHSRTLLNASYVITASAKFNETLNVIVNGLNRAGFSNRDYKVAGNELVNVEPFQLTGKQLEIEAVEASNPDAIGEEVIDTNNITIGAVQESLQSSTQNDDSELSFVLQSIETQAKAQEEIMQKQIEEQENNNIESVPTEYFDKMKSYAIRSSLKEVADEVKLPQFFIEEESSGLYAKEEESVKRLLDQSDLIDGFKLNNQDVNISFEDVQAEIRKIDLQEERKNEYTPTVGILNYKDRNLLLEAFFTQNDEQKVKSAVSILLDKLQDEDKFSYGELKAYLKRVIENLRPEQVQELVQFPFPYAKKIRRKMEGLLLSEAQRQFEEKCDTGNIKIEPFYAFHEKIKPIEISTPLDYRLYEQEGKMGIWEGEIIQKVIACDNILFWHRNNSKSGFRINGFINHYPDFIIYTKSKKIILLETKGDHLDGSDSEAKLRMGKEWANKAGDKYFYFMVFENKPIDSALSVDDFIKRFKQM